MANLFGWMRTMCVCGLLAGAFGAASALAAPVVSLVPANQTVAPGQTGIVFTIRLVNDTNLYGIGFKVERSSGDAVITGATRTIPSPLSGGGSLVVTPTSVEAYVGISLSPLGPGTYSLGTITVSAGSTDAVFAPVLRPGDAFIGTGGTLLTATLVGATLDVAAPVVSLVPTNQTVAPGQAGVVYTIQLVNDTTLFGFGFAVQRTSGDAVITGATRTIPDPPFIGGGVGSLVITPTLVEGYQAAAVLDPLGPGTYSLGTITITAGSADSVFTPVLQPGDVFVATGGTIVTGTLVGATVAVSAPVHALPRSGVWFLGILLSLAAAYEISRRSANS